MDFHAYYLAGVGLLLVLGDDGVAAAKTESRAYEDRERAAIAGNKAGVNPNF